MAIEQIPRYEERFSFTRMVDSQHKGTDLNGGLIYSKGNECGS
jgi:hypothetical protein